ncbi:hypothetical protein ACROYT_G015761 [Oculina patagonica]
MAGQVPLSLQAGLYQCSDCHLLLANLESYLHHDCASYVNVNANISTISSEHILEPPTVHQPTLERPTLERWEDTDVRLLITTYVDNKHRFGGKATKKEVFEKIAEQFTTTSGRLVSGEQCMRKWGKITLKQKEIEDHNQKTGNSKRTWKFYDELSECLAKDATVHPVITMESAIQLDDQNPVGCGSQQLSDNDSSSESTGGMCTSTSDSSGKRGKATKQKRCRKKPKSRSSAAEMLEFLKSYSDKREKVEEEKLKVLKEMKDEKSAFFNRFFEYMDKK